MAPLRVFSFGDQLVRYSAALKLMDRLAEQCKAGASDSLLLLQHHPVYTLGKRGQASDFRVPIEDVVQRGIDVLHVPRGGQVTYHGPGQLVAYPIVNLRRLGRGARAWVEGLEDAVIDTLGCYGLRARGRVPDATGVWVGDRKIAALGVRISHGISTHGVALNVTTDLSAYDLIVPCGIGDKDVTSMQQELTTQTQERLDGPAHTAADATTPPSQGANTQQPPLPPPSLPASTCSDVQSISSTGVQGSVGTASLSESTGGGSASVRCHHTSAASQHSVCVRADSSHSGQGPLFGTGHRLLRTCAQLQPCSRGPTALGQPVHVPIGARSVCEQRLSLCAHAAAREHLTLPGSPPLVFDQVSLAFVEAFCRQFGYEHEGIGKPAGLENLEKDR